MTQDKLIELAVASGFKVDGNSWIHAGVVLVDGHKSIDKQLQRFAELVRKDDREMIECLLSALEYHEEQTRPIHSTTTAIQAAREHLKGMKS